MARKISKNSHTLLCNFNFTTSKGMLIDASHAKVCIALGILLGFFTRWHIIIFRTAARVWSCKRSQYVVFVIYFKINFIVLARTLLWFILLILIFLMKIKRNWVWSIARKNQSIQTLYSFFPFIIFIQISNVVHSTQYRERILNFSWAMRWSNEKNLTSKIHFIKKLYTLLFI